MSDETPLVDPAASVEAPIVETPYVAPAPDGLKAKAMQVGLKAYMAAPEPVQKATIKVVMKVHPVVAKAQPHAKKILAGTGALLVLRKLTRK